MEKKSSKVSSSASSSTGQKVFGVRGLSDETIQMIKIIGIKRNMTTGEVITEAVHDLKKKYNIPT